jgi:hypothetical protein
MNVLEDDTEDTGEYTLIGYSCVEDGGSREEAEKGDGDDEEDEKEEEVDEGKRDVFLLF